MQAERLERGRGHDKGVITVLSPAHVLGAPRLRGRDIVVIHGHARGDGRPFTGVHAVPAQPDDLLLKQLLGNGLEARTGKVTQLAPQSDTWGGQGEVVGGGGGKGAHRGR